MKVTLPVLKDSLSFYFVSCDIVPLNFPKFQCSSPFICSCGLGFLPAEAGYFFFWSEISPAPLQIYSACSAKLLILVLFFTSSISHGVQQYLPRL